MPTRGAAGSGSRPPCRPVRSGSCTGGCSAPRGTIPTVHLPQGSRPLSFRSVRNESRGEPKLASDVALSLAPGKLPPWQSGYPTPPARPAAPLAGSKYNAHY
eukprot:410446-Prymnesium_polylepis.1